MTVISAAFIISAASASDFPTTGFPEIALVGRSNVGKSSLINALVKKTIARTSAAPGKTRLANYYLIEPHLPAARAQPFYLVDLPGYGYARGGEEAAREFEALARQYFDIAPVSRRQIAGALHLVDSRHPELPQDADAHAWLLKMGPPVAIVATKIDKLTRAERTQNLKLLEDGYDTVVVPESALQPAGLDAIWQLLREWLEPHEQNRR